MKWVYFGLSKQVNPRGSHSISGMRGTQNWHSPEILKIFIFEEEENGGKTTSPDIRPRGTVKSDVFSAGLVFGYYLLGGHHPFGSAINVPPNIFKNEPVNLPKIKEHPMHAIIMEMLNDNPDERISSADVVLRIKFFTIQNRVKEYKKKMRQEINAFFKNSKVTDWKESEKNKKFEEMFKRYLDEAKKEFPTTDVMFQYGMKLTVHLMKKVQDQWEKENSVPAKLESNKEILRKNFMKVSNGVAQTGLFASNMADIGRTNYSSV
ncbi:hypothetical protein DAPPUDRAFT_330390 [Daphnia pulex]|uniref:Protein kinase domain-containing protein n=1 Tax=Daphnia pulex TaxID=6669 RepID=E9HJF7_DAPPU|nr:hypothetical protein DAPPUDRAFT_330390 [Daphnia pulex]|eukprot:EFX68077.1 hypothetical protein DAPPUDRAFT_330390 [Daphnia pulex]